MEKNVGVVDRILRTLLGICLLAFGLLEYDGINGNLYGILIALFSAVPFYMAITGTCFMFKWFQIHTLSEAERTKYGHPYNKTSDC